MEALRVDILEFRSSWSHAGSAWRREQASALQAEDVSINRIAAMFGVTRQRISALLKE
jgi:plasmid maintenance system antidote protein VapI